MKPYMFVIAGEPFPENLSCADVASGLIHVWVMDDDQSRAEDRAYAYVKAYGWLPLSTEHAFEILPDTIPRLGEAEALLYRKACQYGIAAHFLASLKAEGQSGDPVQIRPLKPMQPPKDD